MIRRSSRCRRQQSGLGIEPINNLGLKCNLIGEREKGNETAEKIETSKT